MADWQYCELHWRSDGILVRECDAHGQHQDRRHAGNELHTVLAVLGLAGWEMVGVLASPAGIHEYWYYFKRVRS